jgi:dCMP deaminase
MKQMRPSFTEYFMGFAKQATVRSSCIRAQVGAVIVDTNNKIKSTGYNGTPSGVVSCLEKGKCYRVEHNIPSGTRYETCQSIHAEQNAIIQAGEAVCLGGSIYIYGHDQICILCKRFIIQSGLKDIYLQKNEASPIVHITVNELRKQLEESHSQQVPA